MAEELIRVLEEAPAPAPAAASGKYAVGAKVEARYRGKKKWYAGEVTKVDGDVYSITYEDGDVEDGVAEELIRAVEEAASAPSPRRPRTAAVGSKVECRYKGKKTPGGGRRIRSTTTTARRSGGGAFEAGRHADPSRPVCRS